MPFDENTPSVRILPPDLEPWPGGTASDSVAVLMSGGVDSSVTAMLLKEQGLRVLGVTMRIPVSAPSAEAACVDAVAVSRFLGIPHYTVELGDTFEEIVISPFRRAYLSGITPNPCVICNAMIKFGAVWDVIEKEFGIQKLATGHYAQVLHDSGRTYLAQATDPVRDQSYFLYRISAKRLPNLILPHGSRTKAAVREIARKAGLPVSERPDSQELCFAGGGDYRGVLGDAHDAGPGPIRDMSGKVVGKHKGISNYTIGQREGLGVAMGKPVYVVMIDPKDNSVTIGPREAVMHKKVSAREVNVLIPEAMTPGTRFLGKIRSYNKVSACTLTEFADAEMSVEFDREQFAPTPGQHLVLYDDKGRVAAGGFILIDMHSTPGQ
jgi:tRNA-specific 2-thiouridylase